MNSILTDILGMLKRKEISEIENGDFIPFARYRKNLLRSKDLLEDSKVITRVTKVEDLAKYVQDSIPKGYLVYTGLIEDFGSENSDDPVGQMVEWSASGITVNSKTSTLVAPRKLKIISATVKATGKALTFDAEADFEFKIWTSGELANGSTNVADTWLHAGSFATRFTSKSNGFPGFIEDLTTPIEVTAGSMFTVALAVNAGTVTPNTTEVEVSLLVELT